MSNILLSPDFYLGPHYTKDVINMVPDASSLSPQSKWLGMVSLGPLKLDFKMKFDDFINKNTCLRMHFDIRWDLFHPTLKIKQYKPTLAIEPKDSPMFLEGQHIEMTCVKHFGPPPTRLTFVRGRHSTEVNSMYIKRLNDTSIKVLVDSNFI